MRHSRIASRRRARARAIATTVQIPALPASAGFLLILAVALLLHIV